MAAEGERHGDGWYYPCTLVDADVAKNGFKVIYDADSHEGSIQSRGLRFREAGRYGRRLLRGVAVAGLVAFLAVMAWGGAAALGWLTDGGDGYGWTPRLQAAGAWLGALGRGLGETFATARGMEPALLGVLAGLAGAWWLAARLAGSWVLARGLILVVVAVGWGGYLAGTGSGAMWFTWPSKVGWWAAGGIVAMLAWMLVVSGAWVRSMREVAGTAADEVSWRTGVAGVVAGVAGIALGWWWWGPASGVAAVAAVALQLVQVGVIGIGVGRREGWLRGGLAAVLYGVGAAVLATWVFVMAGWWIAAAILWWLFRHRLGR
jgi:hypothetical protein